MDRAHTAGSAEAVARTDVAVVLSGLLRMFLRTVQVLLGVREEVEA